MVQHKADAPTNSCLFNLVPTPLCQLANRWVMLRGGFKSKTNCTALHWNLATWQSIKRCWIVSSLEQNQHCLLPFQFRLAILSLVRITPLFNYHINILIFRGIFSFHKYLLNFTLPLLISALYIELTVNIPDWFKFHRKTSTLSFKWTWLMRATKSCHKVSVWPVKVLLKDTLRGTLSNTDATVAYFFRTILSVCPTILPYLWWLPSFVMLTLLSHDTSPNRPLSPFFAAGGVTVAPSPFLHLPTLSAILMLMTFPLIPPLFTVTQS